MRKLKGLEDIVPFTSVHWHMGEKGKKASFLREQTDCQLGK